MLNAIKTLIKKIIGEASPGTIARTICFFLALVNQVLVSTGHSVLPITNEQVETIVTLSATIITGLIAWWKNNSFTHNAITADGYLKSLKEK